jgi:hypothetical protein
MDTTRPLFVDTRRTSKIREPYPSDRIFQEHPGRLSSEYRTPRGVSWKNDPFTMRTLVLVCWCGWIGQAWAAGVAPVLGVGINSDAFRKGGSGALGALEPTLQWHSTGKVGDYDWEGGAYLQVQDTELSAIPYSFWAKVKRNVSGWALSARADADSADLTALAVNLQAKSPTTSIQVRGTADTDDITIGLDSIKVSQKITGVAGTDLTVTPSYNLRSKRGNVQVNLALRDTALLIDAQRQKITVAQKVGPGQYLAPSVAANGDFELEYRQAVGRGAVTGTYKPNAYVNVYWEDGPWQASVKMPMEGLYQIQSRPKFNLRRTLDMDELK